VLTGARATVKRWRNGGGLQRQKLHVTRELEWKGELESRVESCGEGEVRGWCSPFIGVGGAL
jgi:hypothetical protein